MADGYTALVPRFRIPSGRRVRELYRVSFDDARRERLFLSSISYFVTLGSIRVVTGIQRRRAGPFSSGSEVHHYVYGIVMLLTSGYSWLFLGGKDTNRHRGLARSTTVLYGSASALTIDEFNVWLHVKNDYWKRPMRQIIDGVIVTTSLASIIGWGRPFFVAVAREAVSGNHQGTSDPDEVWLTPDTALAAEIGR